MPFIITSQSHNPYENLALERILMRELPGILANQPVLYLWRNSRTVVIGRNQNPWCECRLELLEAEGGCLARRPSGGGAVFHDLGNLCYSFILPPAEYDLRRQLSVILAACQALGLNAQFSGRNDIVVRDGQGERKFSGNAFKYEKAASLQHGTLLIGVDMSLLARYLVPPASKMQAKGVASVRARVCNLNEYANIDCQSMLAALAAAFEAEYGAARILLQDQLDAKAIADSAAEFASPEWRLGETPPFDTEISHRFDWGQIELLLSLKRGVIECATVYSDAMDETLPPLICGLLSGCAYGKAMAGRIRQAAQDGAMRRELLELADYLAGLEY